MIKINEQLLINSKNELNYQRDVNFSFESLLNMHNHAMNWIATSNPLRLPCLPPPEKHPYEKFFPLNLNFSKYNIGTFPPISYMTDTFANIEFCNGNKVSKPQLPFYHGNRQKLWQYLLTEDDFSELSTDRIIRRKQIIDFLIHNRINYADVISFCQRGEYNADDSNLFNIILNEGLIDIFKSYLVMKPVVNFFKNNIKSLEILITVVRFSTSILIYSII